MKKTALFILIVFSFTSIMKGQNAYRSLATGIWSAPGSWQIRTGINAWANSTTTVPTATDTVFIQSGHQISITAEALCLNLNIDTFGTVNFSGAFNVNVYGKIRSYSAASAEISLVDGSYYGADNTTLTSRMLSVSGGATGALKFVGGSRNLNLATEWNSNGTGNVNVIFALDAGATGTINAGFKAKTYTFFSGTVAAVSGAFMSAGAVGTGTCFLIKNAAKFTTQRAAAIGFSSTKKCDNITIESGGILEFNSTAPTVDCASITNNGTIIYLAGTGSLVTPSAAGIADGAVNITSYKNLVLGGTGPKTIPNGLVINVSDTFSLAGNSSCLLVSLGGSYLTYSAGGTLLSAGTSTNTTLAFASIEWPVTNGPTNVVVTQNKLAFTASAGMSRKITGTLSLLNTVASPGGFTINTGNSLIMANGSTIFRNDANAKITSSTGLLIGELASDKVNITIGNTMTNDVELLSAPTPGGYGTLKILAGTYTVPGSRTITDLNNSGILALVPPTSLTFTINGNLIGTGTVSGNASASLVLSGANAGSAGTIIFTNSFQLLSALTINKTGTTASVNLGSALAISGNLTLTAGTLNDGGNIISLGGSIFGTASGAHASSGSGKILMLTNLTSIATVGSLGNIEINPGATNTITCNTNILNDLILTSGNFDCTTKTITVAGNISGSSVQVATTGRLKMTGSGKTISGITCTTLEIASAGTITANGAPLINTNLTITSGIFNDGGNIISLRGSISGTASGAHASSGSGKILMLTNLTSIATVGSLGNIEINPGASNTITCNTNTLNDLILTSGNFDCTTKTITVAGNISGSSVQVATTGRLKMTGSGKTISGITCTTLEIASAGTITANGAPLVNTNLTITSGIFNDGGNIVTVSGGIQGPGSHVSTGTGKIKMTGITKNISVVGISFGNLEIDPGASNTISSSVSFNVNNELYLTSGTLDVNGNIVTVLGNINGTATQTGSGRLKMVGSGKTISGITCTTIEIATSGTITASGAPTINTNLIITSGIINDGGNVITLAGFLQGPGKHVSTLSGKIKMIGGAKTISVAGIELGNLEIATISPTSTISAAANIPINNNLILTSGNFNDGGFIITVSKDIIGTSSHVGAGGKIQMIGNGNLLSGISSDSLEISSVASISLSGAPTIKGLTLNGTLSDAGNILTVSGNIYGGGTHNSTGTGKISMTGSTKSILGLPTLGNIEVAPGASITSGMAAFISGTLYMNGNNISISSGNTLTMKNNATIIRTSGNLNLVGGTMAIGQSATDAISVVINGNLISSNELPGSTLGKIDLTINSGAAYTLQSNTKSVRNLNLYNGSLAALLDGTGGTTGLPCNLNVSSTATIYDDFTLNASPNPFSLFIAGTIKFGNVNSKTLFSNGNLVIKSNINGTGRVADVTNGGVNSGNTILGDVSVQRYIPSTRRSWRLMSVPTSGNQTIYAAWQNGGIPGATQAGVGTWISSRLSNWSSLGFDGLSAGHSLLTYDSPTSSWIGATRTDTAIATDQGYMIFIRGDRNANTLSSLFSPTTLSTKGPLKVGNYPSSGSIAVNAGTFKVIGNPYASSIDIRNITKTNLDSAVYLWDPKRGSLGAWQTLTYSSAANHYIIVPGTGSYGATGSNMDTIYSGQAFVVRASSSAGTIAFTENAKMSGSANNVFRPAAPAEQLVANLYLMTDSVGELADGTLSLYEDNASAAIDANDARKMTNMTENFSISRNNTLLTVERTPILGIGDTVYFNMSKLKQKTYKIELVASNLNHPNLMGKLIDSYLETTTPVELDGRTNYSFTVTTDSGSFKADRFKLIFYQSGLLLVNGIVLTAEGCDTKANIEWKTDNQINIDHYEIERSYDGIHFINVSRQIATGSNGQSIGYNWLDEEAIKGNNYYRIKAIGKNGEVTNSNIALVKLSKGKSEISVFPTIVHDGKVNVLLTDMPKGIYSVRCIAENGSVVSSQHWTHEGGSMLQSINLNTKTIGNYHIEIKNDNKNKIVKTVLVAK